MDSCRAEFDKEVFGMSDENKNRKERAIEMLLAKGRIAVWLIILATGVLCFFGKITGEQFVDVVKYVAGIWLGAEAAAKGAEIVKEA
mgnify:CR=1 FL=1